jgi:hypothetical protein
MHDTQSLATPRFAPIGPTETAAVSRKRSLFIMAMPSRLLTLGRRADVGPVEPASVTNCDSSLSGREATIMQVIKCVCGARYKVPAQLAGKRVQCKRCSAKMQVPESEPPPEFDDSFSPFADEAAAAASRGASRVEAALNDEETRRSEAHGQVQDPRMSFDVAPSRRKEASSALPGAGSAMVGFWKDSLWSFAFVSRPGSLIIFLIVGACSAFQVIVGAAGIIGGIASFIISGWVASFLFKIVVSAAAGERDLPELTLTDGFFDDVIAPFFKFAATWMIVLVPMIVYVAAVGVDVRADNALEKHLVPVVGLLAFGVFLWPMCVLVISIGGFSSFFRPDLILFTIVRTFVPYVMTCVITGAAVGVMAVAQDALARESGASNPIAVAMVLKVLELYAWVVAMRVIGLYYHHFKQRFAWSWG